MHESFPFVWKSFFLTIHLILQIVPCWVFDEIKFNEDFDLF